VGAATIRELPSTDADARVDELVDLLLAVVADGASINFLQDVTAAEARAFWQRELAGVATGGTTLLVAELDGAIAGTVMLVLAPQPNQQHRADVAKMLVHPTVRRRGIGAALLEAVEHLAPRRHRTLLMLDTEKDSAGERLYASHGWVRYGEVPDHAHLPDGTPKATSFFYKSLA